MNMGKRGVSPPREGDSGLVSVDTETTMTDWQLQNASSEHNDDNKRNGKRQILGTCQFRLPFRLIELVVARSHSRNIVVMIARR
jgi:hypothetical protein